MKAVVMAGGEGTRLRPLTSNQPKPMVPIVGKPCMEHILELLRKHGFDDVIVTLAFLPQAIRSYFGDGDALGLNVEYSVEESPLGTAGSVRLASGKLDDTVLVISGDALCDIDLGKLLAFHHEKGAAVTIGLKSVENPLEFGIVVTDEDGRIERFLEKPSWGQVFSDTINTGIYVLEPEVLKHVPTDRPYDFSKELFPLLLEMGRPLYGMVCDGYWQDIGNLDQFRQANFDALDGQVDLAISGMRLRGNVWIGEGVEIDDLEDVEGPAFIGNYCRISPQASIGPYSVLSASVTLRERARTVRSVIDASTHVGRSALVEGAVVGRNCDIRSHVRIQEGAAVGDEVVLGAQSQVMPGVRIYPYKEVESGAHIHESLIWESRASSALFGKDGVNGLINVDLTPDVAVRLAAGARDGAQARVAGGGEPRVRPRLPDDQAGDDHWPERGRRRRRRPAGAALGRGPTPDEDAGLRRRHPRGHQPERSGDDLDPLLRAAGDPDDDRPREGGREALQPPRAPPRAVRRHRQRHLSGPGARAVRAGPADAARQGRDRAACVPGRRRLRLLGVVVRASAGARAARDRGGLGARVHHRVDLHGLLAARVDRAGQAAGRCDRRRPRSGLRPGRRPALPRRRAGPRDPRRAGRCSCSSASSAKQAGRERWRSR